MMKRKEEGDVHMGQTDILLSSGHNRISITDPIVSKSTFYIVVSKD